MKRRFGFTLIELLVVVAIIALLVSILMPALGRARELANQVKCATQLNGIGKAIALYGNDYKEAYPTICATSGQGGNQYFWSTSNAAGQYRVNNPRWNNANNWIDTAAPNGYWTYPTAGGCLYLLVRYEDLVPNMFLCPSADYGEEMDLQLAISGDSTQGIVGNANIENWSDCLDFHTIKSLSYSVHDPFNKRLDASSTSSMPVMADMSPVTDVDLCNGKADPDWAGQQIPDSGDNADAGTANFNPDWTDRNGANLRPGNSPNHGYDAQNILFADSHVKKHDRPDVGIQDDNIYTHWVVGQTGNPTGQNNCSIGVVNTPAQWTTSVNTLSQGTQDAFLGN